MGLLRAVVLVAVVGACACACDGCEPEVVVDAAVGKRTVSLSWRLTDPAGGELACDRVDGQFVTVSFFRTRTGQGFTEVFDCFRRMGSRALEEGEHTIGFELADRFGTIARIAPRRYDITGDQALDEVVFQVEPSGGLVLALDTGQPANCSSGSQITGMTIALYRADGACETATLAIEGGGSYAVSCAAPNIAPCIEKDRDVTASLPAGEYRIQIVGLHGANPCWEHDQRHRVRAAGLVRTLMLPLTKTCN
jgi:hypothetical protein